jgi:FAD/FMN-containing dehydrogenases
MPVFARALPDRYPRDVDSQPVTESYLEDASGFRGYAERVIIPGTEAALCEAVREASAAAIPITISGSGTGVTGGRVAQGGWVLSLERLRKIEIFDGFARAGAGASLRDLQAAARQRGQFYAPDPTEWSASIGGSIATNASGSRSFRYGATRKHVRALRVVLADGSLRSFRRGEPIDFDVPLIRQPAARKHSAGYPLRPGMDWVDLFIGSEGTLGVVVEAELTLLPLPEELLTGVIFFPSDEKALHAVDAWRPIKGLRMLEYFDHASLDLLRPKFPATTAAAAAILFEQELEGDEEEIDRWESRLSDAGALTESSWFASSDSDRERFRRFRHALPETVNDLVRRNGFTKIGSDYAVPIHRNLEMLAFYRQKLDELFPENSVIFGHIGDAHVHVNILPRSQAEFDRARELMIEFARKVVSMDGSVAAEHGLGKRKAHLLELQYSAADIEAMKAVKRRLDPQWLLGRGNLFPAPGLR